MATYWLEKEKRGWNVDLFVYKFLYHIDAFFFTPCIGGSLLQILEKRFGNIYELIFITFCIG